MRSLVVVHILRSRWKFRICTTTNDLILYNFCSLYIFVTWRWPTVAETCRQPNKQDTRTVVFWRTHPLLICPETSRTCKGTDFIRKVAKGSPSDEVSYLTSKGSSTTPLWKPQGSFESSVMHLIPISLWLSVTLSVTRIMSDLIFSEWWTESMKRKGRVLFGNTSPVGAWWACGRSRNDS